MNTIEYLIKPFSNLNVNALTPLDVSEIHTIPWYKRFEMSLQLATQLEALHDSGKAHRLIGLKAILLDAQGRAVLQKSVEETEDGLTNEIIGIDMCYVPPERKTIPLAFSSHKQADMYALGLTLYQLLFLQPEINDKKLQKADTYIELLQELELLNDDEAIKFLIYWMCHPQAEKRATCKDVTELLKAISENCHTPLYRYTPDHPLEDDAFDAETVDQFGKIVESFFEGTVHNGYLTRAYSERAYKIICLSDLIILLPSKDSDSELQSSGTVKLGRPVDVLRKVDGIWRSTEAYALTSKKSPVAYFKASFRKERELYRQLESKGFLPRHITTVSFAEKPDKILSVYEKGIDLFTYVTTTELTPQSRVSLCCSLIDLVHNLHLEGYIHRDIKADNIVVTADGKMRLCDIDKMIKNPLWHHLSDIVGTPEHTPPERFDLSYSGSWDSHEIYALGALLLEILGQYLPWDRNDHPKEAAQVAAKWEYVKVSEAARKYLTQPNPAPVSNTQRLNRLASWMTHPDVLKRATWADVLTIRKALS